jgi:putative transposase
MDERFRVEALEEAMRTAGRAPAIINTDQGSQFIGEAWRGVVEAAGARISMDGKGRWMDNAFIERLWRGVKHEGVYLWAYQDPREVETALGEWFATYNHFKPHQSLPDQQTPWQYYRPEQADVVPKARVTITTSQSTKKAA